jgi:hypothetical protein
MAKRQNSTNTKKQQIESLLAFHKKKIFEAQEIMMDEETKPCYDYIVNTSGGKVILPDFHALSVDPDSPKTFTLEPGARLNLRSKFDIKDINRNREGLEIAASMEGIYGFPAITFVEDIRVEFPVPLVKKTPFEKGMEEKEKFGSSKVQLASNEFDEKLVKDFEKEKRYNEKIADKSAYLVNPRKSKKELEQEEIDNL